LGDHAGEAGIRAGFRAALHANATARRVATVEAADTLERVTVTEATSGGVRPVRGKPAEITVDIIRSGWNRSGTRYYPAEVLERDIPVCYPAGTHMYVNHPGQVEAEDRPERSLYDLAAVFTSTPYAVREGDQTVMRVTARAYSRHREFLAEAAGDIGVSINGNGDGSITEREGRTGLVLERLTHGQSVDFVTKPGAGGRIVALLEAHRGDVLREAASLGGWLESRIHLGFTQLADDLYGDGRLSRDERIAASSAVGDALAAFVKAVEDKAPALYQRSRWANPDTAGTPAAATREAAVEAQREALDRALQSAYGGDDRYAWLHDFDPDAGVAWFRSSGKDTPSALWQQKYTRGAAGVITLDGARVEVRARTVYDPVDPGVPTQEAQPGPTTQTPDGAQTPPGPPADEATTAKETAMTDTTVKDAAAREADEATRIREAIRTQEATELAQYRQADKARGVLDSKLAESTLPALSQSRIRAEFPATRLPLIESDRTLDVAAFTRTVEAAIAAESDYVTSILEAAGVGKVTGNGAAPGAGAGAPTSLFGTPPLTGGVLFGAAAGGVFGAPVTEAQAVQDKQLREALIDTYVRRGQTREAAERAVDARI
jgi:hypothetical protein